MIAVADTGPLLYLSLIHRVGLLPQIFEKVLIPQAVADELSHPSTPAEASALVERCPPWLHLCSVPSTDSSLDRLEQGEREAITLAVSAGAGIVADSVPETEFIECVNKARAVVRAIERARQS